MSLASGTLAALSYVAESTRGTTPGSPTMKALRATSRGVNHTKNILESAEVRADRQKSDVRHGLQSVGGQLGFELSLIAYNDMIESLLGGTWTAVVIASTGNLSIASNVLVRASGSWISDLVKPGMMVTLSGFTDPANNGVFIAGAPTDATHLPLLSSAALVDEGAASRTVSVAGKYLAVGNAMKTFTFERRFTDIAQYQLLRGCIPNQMNLNVTPQQIVSGTMDIIGMSASAWSGSSAGSPTAAATHSPFSSFDGALFEGNTLISIITGLQMTINNNRSLGSVVGSKTSPDVFDGTLDLTGTVNAYFSDAAMLNKFVNETESSLYLRLLDLDGTNSMVIGIPRLKYTGGTIDPPQSGPISIALPFRGLVDTATNGSGSCIVVHRSDT